MREMKLAAWMVRVAAILTILAGPMAPAATDGKGMVVRVVGEAAIENGNVIAAKEQALAQAKRAAVEQGVGVFVTAEALGRDFVLVEEKIITKSEGFVESYTILDEKAGANKIYWIKIEAVVKSLDLVKELFTIPSVIEAMQSPRVMISGIETNMGEKRTSDTTIATALAEEFKKRGMTVKHAEFALGADAAQARTKALKQALQSGCEILVWATAETSEQSIPELAGTGLHSAFATLKADVFYTVLDGELLFSRPNITASAGSPGSAKQAGYEAIKKAAQKLLSDENAFSMEVLATWANEVQNGRVMLLDISGLSARKELQALRKKLQSMPNFVLVVRESLELPTAQIFFKIKDKPDNVADELDGTKISPNKKFVVKTQQSVRIGGALIKG